GRTVLRPLPRRHERIDGQHEKHETDQPSLPTSGDKSRHRDHAKQDRASNAIKNVESVEEALDHAPKCTPRGSFRNTGPTECRVTCASVTMSRMGAADSGPGLSAPTVTVVGDALIRSEPDEAV